MKTSAKSAFSLIEMLVVIGIIGILAGVLLSTFGGATDSARATKCVANMRNLATAANTYAMRETNGHFPSASSYKFAKVINGKLRYPQVTGWISWDQRTNNDRDKGGGSPIPLNTQNDADLWFALTNGVLWNAIGGARSAYLCPIHSEAVRKANGGRMPGWSYVMNQEFGYDKNGQARTHYCNQTINSINITRTRASSGESKGTSYRRAPDKVLMFAELQGLAINDARTGIKVTPNLVPSGKEADCTLQYEDQREVIGFNHKMSRGRYAGHVAFADGHVEKIFYPIGGMSVQDLTENLCQGHEVTFDGTKYTDAQR